MINLILFISSHFDQNYFDQLKVDLDLKNDEKVIITFQTLDNCIKCYQIPFLIIMDLRKIKNIPDFKVLCFLKCNRKKELDVFKKKFDWNDYLMMDKGDARLKLGLKKDTHLAIIDANGSIMFEFNQENMQDIDKCVLKITKALNSK